MNRGRFEGIAVKLGHRVLSAEDFPRFREGKTVDEVETALESGRVFGVDAAAAAKVWIAQQRREDADRRDLERLALERRATEAAERSAKWAKLAVFISLGALFLSAWPFFAWVRA